MSRPFWTFFSLSINFHNVGWSIWSSAWMRRWAASAWLLVQSRCCTTRSWTFHISYGKTGRHVRCIGLLQVCCWYTSTARHVTSLYSMTGEMQTNWHWKCMLLLVTLRRNVPALIRLRRVEPAPNCPDAELASPNWRRRVVLDRSKDALYKS